MSARVRTLSSGLLMLSIAAIGLGVAKGLSTGHLLESGSNNRLAILAGLVLATVGLVLRHDGWSRRATDALRRSEDGAPTFLAKIQSGPLSHVRFSVWLGFTAGLAESLYRAYHTLENPWPHSLWLGPLTNGVLFGCVGFVVPLVLRVGTWPVTRVTLGLLLTLAFAGWTFVVAPGIHPVAAVVLAVGVAVQVSSMFARYPELAWAAIGNAGRLAMFATFAIMAWMAPGAPASLAAGRTAHSTAGRNVLLLVLDTVSAREISFLGYERPTTPQLEKWASRGVVFESAFSTAPWTLPSHVGMFTGREAHELGTSSQAALDGRFPTIAEVMRGGGYATSGVVGNLGYATRKVGLARGFDHYEDVVISAGEAVLSTALGRAAEKSDSLRNLFGYHQLMNRKPASRISGDFRRWLDQNRTKPFFAFLNYFDAHEPYMPPRPDADRFRSGPAESRGAFDHHVNNIRHAEWRSLSRAQVAQERALHDAAIASIDREIGALLDGLEARGVLSNTVVIVTADHGEAFGEHGIFEHGNSLYTELLHVPLMIIEPGMARAARVKESVSLRDLPATVLDLADIEVDSPFPGASLSRYWRASARAEGQMPFVFLQPAAPVASYTPLARGTMYSVIADPYHYVLNGDGIEELFNYRTDPTEQQNLAGSPAAASVLPRLRRSLPKRIN